MKPTIARLASFFVAVALVGCGGKEDDHKHDDGHHHGDGHPHAADNPEVGR